MYKLSKRSIKRLSGIDPVLIVIAADAISDCPHDFGIPQHGGLRTPDEQNALFKARKSQRDGFVKRSHHQTGKAFDIYGYIDGKATWDPGILEEIAHHIKTTAFIKYKINLIWGGDWKNFKDMPHFQIK